LLPAFAAVDPAIVSSCMQLVDFGDSSGAARRT
jgi:hypothetical protein